MIFQHKDGELRIIEHGKGGTTLHFEILFTDANISGPLGRTQREERMVMDRGVWDSNAHYVEGGDVARTEPMGLTFSCRAADTPHSQALADIMSGATARYIPRTITGRTTASLFYTRKGQGIMPMGPKGGLTSMPNFAGAAYKVCYRVEVLYSGTSNWGFAWDEVYFPPAEQTVAESEDALTLNLNGQIFGDVTRIVAFSTPTKAVIG